MFVVSGTPPRLLGTRHLFQALCQRDTSGGAGVCSERNAY